MVWRILRKWQSQLEGERNAREESERKYQEEHAETERLQIDVKEARDALKELHRKQLCRLDLPDLATLSSTANLPSGAGKYTCRRLEKCHPDYVALQAMFHQSMKSHRASLCSAKWCNAPDVDILSIEEVLNSKMQSLYESARSGEARDRNPQGCPQIKGISAWQCSNDKAEQVCLNEYLLFHGCPVEAVDSIAREGFDPQLGGQAVGGMFGKGTYFAENASKSDLYTTCSLCKDGAQHRECRHPSGERRMIVARVLLGHSGLVKRADAGRATASLRPDTGNVRRCYDSHVAVSRAMGGVVDHLEFIVFKQQLALVRYVITYRHKASCVCHMCQARKATR